MFLTHMGVLVACPPCAESKMWPLKPEVGIANSGQDSLHVTAMRGVQAAEAGGPGHRRFRGPDTLSLWFPSALASPLAHVS